MTDMKDLAYRIGCECGCWDGFEFRAAFGRLYVHSFRGDWYSEQSPVTTAVSDRLKYMRGEKSLRDIIVDPGALLGLKDFLESVEFEPCWRSEGYRFSTLSFSRDDGEGGPLYMGILEGRMPGRGVLLGWYHRMFDVDLGPDDRDRLVREIEEALGD